MLRNTSSPRNYIIIYILFMLGLRNNELRSLRIEDIDFVERNVKVVQGKGKKDRYIPMPNPLVDPLQKWIGGRKNGWLIEGRQSQGTLSNRHLRRIVKEIAQISNIRNPFEVHPHTLRHSYATFIINNGGGLREIQELLGHANISSTQVYTHIAHEKLKETIDKVFT
jgi:site-specific recombinase XerD